MLFVLGQVALLPKRDKSTVDDFVFPEVVPLPQWQLKSSKDLSQQIQNNSELLAQRNYKYTRKDLPLNIEMRYVKIGDVNQLIKKYTQISSSVIIRQREGIGYYGLGFEQQKAYLSACINPQGYSTFTNTQFNENQQQKYQYWELLLSWLFAQKQVIKDKRCLWSHLSVPLKNSSPEATYQVLEAAWFSWYQYWHSRLQKP
ncbi:cyanoexosortase A system-associated protein [Fischerella sp. JS2]|uniref:cyanoexosortase A system-associated protein n=1 Tax=Fischerella sp. JS2 TaxID=2597771 RepID=UPI0028E5482A|nr:cyanoexosortase A system-associated protein [Fischerella sp. JS2]